jgi:sugar lactone lactonase YvrE
LEIAFEPVARGYYLEGLYVEGDEAWFTDVAEGGVRRLVDGKPAGHWLPERMWIGGLLRNADGCMLVSGERGIVWFDPESNACGVLIEGFPGVNEMRADGRGGLYFGTVDLPAIIKGERPGPASIYHLSPDRKLTLLAEGLRFCNGLSPSADGAALFHNESFNATFAYPILSDGSLGEKALLLKKGDCDGMALDAAGNIWISGFNSGELTCISPDGTVIDTVKLPGTAATNVRFAGADRRDVYVTVVTPEAATGLKDGELPPEKTSVLYRGRGSVTGAAMERTRFLLG